MASNIGGHELLTERTLEQMVLMLSRNSWIFDFKLTRFFLDRVWEKVPSEWTEALTNMTGENLAGLPFGQFQPGWPASLNQFIKDCLSLSLPRNLSGAQSHLHLCLLQTGPQLPVNQSGAQLSQTVHLSGQDAHFSSRGSGTGPQPSCESRLIDSECRKPELFDLVSEQAHSRRASSHMSAVTELNMTEFNAATILGGLQFVKLKQNIDKDYIDDGTEDLDDILNPIEASEIDDVIKKGMSSKKLHEVCHMTALVDHVMKRSECNGVVDVGSGLGYLGQVLHTKFGHPVLGLEGKQSHTSGAEKRAVQSSSCPFLHNVTCELQSTAKSNQELLILINDWFTSLSQEVSFCCHWTGSKNSASEMSRQHQINDLQSAPSNETGSSAVIPKNCRTTDETLYFSNSLLLDKKKEKCHNLSVSSSPVNNLTADLDLDKETKISNRNTAKGTSERRNFKDFRNSETVTKTEKCSKNFECPYTETGEKGAVFPNTEAKICMVGLHCCGDLTPTMLKCFLELDCIRSLCLVSCCYHRMRFDACSGQFLNFPMSSGVRGIIDRLAPSWNPGPYGMRLAAQETRARWKVQTTSDRYFHIKNVAYRGILEACLEKGKYLLTKASRKLAHDKDFNDFSTYTDAISKHIDIPKTENAELYLKHFREVMSALYHEYQQYFSYIEPVTALQVLLQSVLESLIYQDRQLWLLENGISCDITTIFDDFISPRNMALVAVK